MITTIDQVMTLIQNRIDELEKRRTRALARNIWGDVIDVEARINECKKLKATITKEDEQAL